MVGYDDTLGYLDQLTEDFVWGDEITVMSEGPILDMLDVPEGDLNTVMRDAGYDEDGYPVTLPDDTRTMDDLCNPSAFLRSLPFDRW